MARNKLRILAAAALAAAAIAAVVLRPQAGPAAARLTAEIAALTGARVEAGPGARFGWAWPLRLEMPSVAIAGWGTLESLVAQGDRIAGRATLFGRTGELTAAGGSLSFAGEGVSARLDRAKGLILETTVAGHRLRVSGRPSAAGLDALSVDWDAVHLSGTARWADGGAALSVEATGEGARLSGTARPAEGAFEGTLESPFASLGRVTSELRATAEAVDFARFVLEGPDLRADGSLRVEAARMSLDLRLADAPLAAALALAGEALARGGDVDLRLRAGRLAWPSGEAQGVILVAAREGGKFVLDELAVRSIAQASVRVRDGIVDLQAPDAARFLAALGVPGDRHLGALSLRGAFAFDPAAGTVRASPVEIALAGQALKGTAEWSGGRLVAALAGDRVSLDPFFGVPLARPAVRGPLLTRSQQARAAAAAAPPPAGPGGWSRVPFRPDLVGGMPLELTLEARELVYSALALRDARLALSTKAGGIEIGALSGGLFGGTLDARGQVLRARAPEATLEFTLAGAEFARLLSAAGAPPVLRGPLTLKGRLAAAGTNPADMAAGLSGEIMLDSPGGTLDGVDLAGLFAYAAASATPDLAELGRRLARGGSGAFTAATATLKIERGTARLSDARLAASGGALALSGLFDLANWRVDLAGDIAAPGARQVPRIAIAGPPARPNVRIGFSAAAGAEARPAGSGAPPRAPAPRR